MTDKDRHPLAKRINRQVTGRIRNYFIATGPGLEKLCLQEVTSKVPDAESSKVVPGGVSMEGKLTACHQANLHLRTANRVLLRINTFKATNFGRLEKRLSEIPWEMYLHRGVEPKISVSARGSRLHHTGAVAERIRTRVARRLEGEGHPPGDDRPDVPQTLFARLLDDRVTLSIDGSGELLHKRGIKAHAAEAPIRETLAAAILMLAGYRPPEPLIDPLCGAGTFSLEAALMAAGIPPGWWRTFAFMGWPGHRRRRWDHLKASLAETFPRADRPAIFASDRDKSACDRLETTLRNHGLDRWVAVRHADLSSLTPESLTSAKGLAVVNPPYGLRLGTPEAGDRLFLEIIEKLVRDYRGWRVALLAPRDRLIRAVPFAVSRYPIHHGGLRLTLLVGRIE